MRWTVATVALVLLIVGGCKEPVVAPEATPAPPAPPETTEPAAKVQTPRAPVPSQNDNLLGYFAYLRKLPGPDLAREHDTVRQSYTAARSDYARVRYAMVITVPGTAFYDDARALEALDPLLKNQNAELHNLALLINTQIQEQRKGLALQQKLDALRSLDKDMLERETGGAKRK